ncbi:MAG: amidohydrolase [Candidatus Eisenbacteria bacterium]|uniref:Amidohydrolase n=1 Tax=Eiseniibacteriota bacterium TaxID=2212470 RepID=A0A7Y2H1Z1_UNCEI|nr:amidohydrolase [Candidatus Eisenbacteria bacterium]
MKKNGPVSRSELVSIRRDIHQHPELGFEENRTSELVKLHLKEFGLKPKSVAGTGVSSVFGKNNGPTLMLRCDLDALPIHEENTFGHKSKHDGVMHACGHDLHTAILLGTAKSLSQDMPSKGRVKLNFQPAEEGLNGADAMIKGGIMDAPKVDAVLGYHIWQQLPVGKIGVVTGPAMAAVDRFEVKISGKGGHAAMPNRSVDPVVVAAQIVTALQTIVSRNLNPLDTGVVTVGAIHGGSAFNIIPPFVTMEGTVRTFSKEAGKTIPKRFKEIVNGVCKAMNAKAEINYIREHSAVVNDAKMASFMRDVARDLFGARNVLECEPSMGGEDHSAYQELVPGCYVFVGAGPTKGEVFPHHHPRFNPDEGVLEVGAELMSEAARRWLAQN